MVKFPSTGAGNDLQLQADIRREAGAPPGPVSFTPGQGYVEVLDGEGTRLFGGSPENGIDLFVHGATRSLPGEIEKKASLTYVDGNVRTLTARDDEQQVVLDAHSDRLTQYGQSITSLGTRMGNAEGDIEAHGTRLTNYGNSITSLGTRMGGAESRIGQNESDISAHGTRLSNYGSSISSLGSRMGNAESSIANRTTYSYVDGNIGTLRDRDDYLYTHLRGVILFLQAKFSDAPGWPGW